MPNHSLDGQLSGEEDVTLSEEKVRSEEYLNTKYVRPQGIETLRERSAILLPVGKHKGKTHRTVFEQDMGPWAKSCIARFRAMAEAKLDREPESVHQGGQEGQESRAPKAGWVEAVLGQGSDIELCEGQADHHERGHDGGAETRAPRSWS